MCSFVTFVPHYTAINYSKLDQAVNRAHHNNRTINYNDIENLAHLTLIQASIIHVMVKLASDLGISNAKW